jgi:hypothetical protein
MQAKIPQLSAGQAKLQALSVGQLSLGPISVGSLAIHGVDVSLSATQAVLQNLVVTLSIAISVEWDVHIDLPWPLSDIDFGDTFDLGSFSFTMPVGTVTIPGLTNLKFDIPSLAAQRLSASATPVSIQATNVAADALQVNDVALPASGFSLAGLSITSLAAGGIGVPAANVGHASVQHLHGDPLKLPAFTLNNLALPAVQIPTISSTVPLDIPANLQGPSPGFDAGILRVVIHIVPTVHAHVDHLDITGASGSATAQDVVLHDVTLPYDALNLTLSQVGIETLQIPSITVA